MASDGDRQHLVWSDELKMHVTIREHYGYVNGAECEDGVMYNASECRIIIRGPQQITAQVHTIKKIFDGEIIAAARNK